MGKKKEKASEQKKITHHHLAWLEHKLLVKLQQVEPIFRLPRLCVYFGEELANDSNHLREYCLVRTIRRCMPHNGFK